MSSTKDEPVKMADTQHKSHRKRMREKYAERGVACFKEHELLEILLYGMLPRQNTNVVAHRLIDSFGSLTKTLSASKNELVSVKGVGEALSASILSYNDIVRHIGACESKQFNSKRLYKCAVRSKRRRLFYLPCGRNIDSKSVFSTSLDKPDVKAIVNNVIRANAGYVAFCVASDNKMQPLYDYLSEKMSFAGIKISEFCYVNDGICHCVVDGVLIDKTNK